MDVSHSVVLLSRIEDCGAESGALCLGGKCVGTVEKMVLPPAATEFAPDARRQVLVSIDSLFEVVPQMSNGNVGYDGHGWRSLVGCLTLVVFKLGYPG